MSDVLETVEIKPADRPVDADVRLPGSKSYTNRALLVAALAEGESRIEHALFSDDTCYMIGALRALGVEISEDRAAEQIRVRGAAGAVPVTSAEVFVGNAGTAARFLTAYLALGNGRYRLDGVARMRERPIGPLLDALRQLGVDARSEHGNDCPPVVIAGRAIEGGQVTIAGDVSSQFISALMMIGPCTARGIDIVIQGSVVSRPYLDLTTSVMQTFGVVVERPENRRIVVPGQQRYRGQIYRVEPDASAASYFLAAAAVTGGRVRVEALGRRSVQGDARFAEVLEAMGCFVTRGDDFLEVWGPAQLRGIDVDLGDLSDVAQSLAAIAPFASSPVRIRGIAHIRHKETDRLRAVTTELQRLGARVREYDDGWEIYPSTLQPAVIETYEDHRMAMSFAVTGLRVPGLRIANPGCVAKTFPDFFERFSELSSSR